MTGKTRRLQKADNGYDTSPFVKLRPLPQMPSLIHRPSSIISSNANRRLTVLLSRGRMCQPFPPSVHARTAVVAIESYDTGHHRPEQKHANHRKIKGCGSLVFSVVVAAWGQTISRVPQTSQNHELEFGHDMSPARYRMQVPQNGGSRGQHTHTHKHTANLYLSGGCRL